MGQRGRFIRGVVTKKRLTEANLFFIFLSNLGADKGYGVEQEKALLGRVFAVFVSSGDDAGIKLRHRLITISDNF